MTRPTVLDMDLVVVPREAAQVMLDEVTAADQHEPFSDTTMSSIFDAMLYASPYPTAWDDVRKYVEGLEADVKREANLATTYAIDCMDEQKRAEAAEARIAELEKRLADAERVIDPFAAKTPFVHVSDLCAARAYMEGK